MFGEDLILGYKNVGASWNINLLDVLDKSINKRLSYLFAKINAWTYCSNPLDRLIYES